MYRMCAQRRMRAQIQQISSSKNQGVSFRARQRSQSFTLVNSGPAVGGVVTPLPYLIPCGHAARRRAGDRQGSPAGAARRIMQVLTACATSLSLPSTTSHSMSPSVRPAFLTRARAAMRPARTARRKFTFISTVV
jgi:hypothetical protein